MTRKTYTTTIVTYTIDSHPNPEKVYDWIRNNWHDVADHEVDDFIASFEALANYLGLRCDYLVSALGNRCDFIKLIGDIDKEKLEKLKHDDLPLTGCCWDYSVISALKNDNLNQALSELYKAGRYRYSSEGLKDWCEANEYEFTEEGQFYI